MMNCYCKMGFEELKREVLGVGGEVRVLMAQSRNEDDLAFRVASGLLFNGLTAIGRAERNGQINEGQKEELRFLLWRLVETP